jgi:hypothetical protein
MRKVKVKTYNVISEKMEEWIPYGIHRYYKHRDEKEVEDIAALIAEIHASVMLGLDEVIDWDG